MALLRRRIPNFVEHDPKLTSELQEFNSWEDLYKLGFPKKLLLDGEYLLAEPKSMGLDYKFKGYDAQKVLIFRCYLDINMESRPNYPPRYEYIKPVAIIFDCTNLENLQIKEYKPITEKRF